MVLRARGIESEAQIPFASLLELLRPALPLLGQLPAPQAAALEQAFALRPGRTQDRFAVGAATLGLLAACAEQQPLLVLLDDIQWFDAPSSEALRFALRRLDGRPGRRDPRRPRAPRVAARRHRDRRRSHSTGLSSRPRPACSAPTCRRRRRSDWSTSPAATRWRCSSSLPTRRSSRWRRRARRCCVSARISAAYLRRATALDARHSQMPAAGGASDSGELQLLGRAAARDRGRDRRAAVAAEDAGLVTVASGRVEFQHPLVRSAVYSDATLGARREAHRALAAVLPDRELDRRAWHLAAAAVGTDETASQSRSSTRRAHSLERGGYASAAAAFERAARLTDDAAPRATACARGRGGMGRRAAPSRRSACSDEPRDGRRCEHATPDRRRAAGRTDREQSRPGDGGPRDPARRSRAGGRAS